MPASDVPRGARVFVDAPEEEWPGTVGEQRDSMGEGGHVVEVGVPRRDEVIEQPLCPLTHGAQRLQCTVEVGLFGRDLGVGRGSAASHRTLSHDKRARHDRRAKIPGHTGDGTHLLSLLQALHLAIHLLLRPDFEPLPSGLVACHFKHFRLLAQDPIYGIQHVWRSDTGPTHLRNTVRDSIGDGDR